MTNEYYKIVGDVPLYRAKKLNSDEVIEGHLVRGLNTYIIPLDSFYYAVVTEPRPTDKVHFSHSGYLADPATLSMSCKVDCNKKVIFGLLKGNRDIATKLRINLPRYNGKVFYMNWDKGGAGFVLTDIEDTFWVKQTISINLAIEII